jgi:hypothetical protein
MSEDRPDGPRAGRVLWAGLHLLDRQLLDREGLLCGCVDDLELARGETGTLHVTGIVSGPGALVQRLNRSGFGPWVRWLHAVVSPGTRDPARIPFNVVSDVGDHVTLAADEEDVGSASVERWVRDHVIAHIPGSGHAPE